MYEGKTLGKEAKEAAVPAYSMNGEITMGTRKLVGVWLLVLVVFGLNVAVAASAEDKPNKTKVIKSKESGTFASTNFDFDHSDLSTPANYRNGEGIGSAGKFTEQAVDELAPDGKTCTVPGGATGAGTEFTLVGDVSVVRFEATGDLLFSKATSITACQDFTTPPFPFVLTDTGVITGGTGKYSGATGTFTANVKGATLSVDATAARVFGWFKGTTETTVTVP